MDPPPPLWDVNYVYFTVAMAIAMAMAMAMAAAAAAAAVIRPEHAGRGRPPRKSTFIEKRSFRPILAILEPSRPQKWIRLEISSRMVLSGGLEVKNKATSLKIYGSEGGRSAPEVKASPNRNKHIPNRIVSSQVGG